MKRRWIVPAGVKANTEIAIERDGRLTLHVSDGRESLVHHVAVELTESDRLDLIEALKAAGRSRAGIKREPAKINEVAA